MNQFTPNDTREPQMAGTAAAQKKEPLYEIGQEFFHEIK